MSGALSLDFAMTQETIDLWADLSGDFNPLHVDEEYAATTPFGGTIAHGHTALAILTRLFVEAFREDWMTRGEFTDVKFRSPVRPGRSYRAVAERVDAADGDDPEWTIAVRDADGTECVVGRAFLRQGVAS